ncbi:MAG: GSCFA domain-containing protein, partial [Cyclobacteriaceae bacterium]|nr:GSCFA domain-containing protein [Cyclobacteriaceae bacterium]
MHLPLRTEIDSKAKSFSIGLHDPILTLGSCFAQTIGDRFRQNKFSAMTNPFGTVYHPLAIHKLIRYSALQEFPADDTYVTNDGLYFNYDFHSSFVNSNKGGLRATIETTIERVNHFIRTCRILVLTYGTAFIYDRKDNGSAVANCHKIPSSNFSKRLSSPEEITTFFLETMSILRSINPSLRVILTVSPVRHTRNTLELNSVSKSILRLACHQMVNQEKTTDYFPSYEIMMD